MTNLKKGDLITVQAEQVKRQYRETDDYTKVFTESDENDSGFGGLEELSKTHIFRIEKDDLHKDLSKFGLSVGHFTLRAIKVESLTFPVEGEVRINGEYDIPFKSSRKSRLAETYFFDEGVAKAIATGLNMAELEKMEELQGSVGKGITMLNQILESAHV